MKPLLFLLLFFLFNGLQAQQSHFSQLIEMIQAKVKCCSVPFAASSPAQVTGITIEPDGSVTLFYSDKRPKNRFHLLELYQEKASATGMDTILNGNVIQFSVSENRVRLLRFATRQDTKEVYDAFLQLLSYPTAKGAVYFISRNVPIATSNKTLFFSIRAIDTTTPSGSGIAIPSQGEGWLDKDSLPVGVWRFYAKNDVGEAYLFKSGSYQRTEASMFQVNGIDSVALAKGYGKSFEDLKQEQVQVVPFIKSGVWTYYHPDGSVWKTTSFLFKDLPITTKIVQIDLDRKDMTRLIIELNDPLDEWTRH